MRTLLTFLLLIVAVSISDAIECPDDKAIDLLTKAKRPDSEEQYWAVLQDAVRPMDQPALRSACFGLAHRLHNDGSMEPNRLRGRDEIEGLKLKHPALSACATNAIYRDDWLPIVRYSVIPTAEIISKEIVGWVEFDLTIDEQGMVEAADIVESTHSALEGVAMDAVIQFEYQPRLDTALNPIRVEHVTATVTVDYFDLAWADGCRWKRD